MSIKRLRELHAACCGQCDEQMAGRKWDGDQPADRHPYWPGKRKEIGKPPLAGPDGSPQRKKYNDWWRSNFWTAKAADCMGALACMDEPAIDEVMDDQMLDDVFGGRKWDGDKTKADRAPYYPGKRKEIGKPPLAGQPGSAERKNYNNWWRNNFWNAKSAMDHEAALEALRTMKYADQQVAKTILAQMGGQRRLMAMLGAKNFVTSSNSVSFKWPNKQRSKGNSIKVSLRGDDTYDVEFFNVTRSAAKSVKKHSGVYAEDLVSIFERQTGWYLRLGRQMFSAEGFRRMFAEDSEMGLYADELFAEGCPDNLDEKQCEEWEKNTLFHKDQFKEGGVVGPYSMDREFAGMRAAKAGDQREQDKMWAKGYRYMIQWAPNSNLKNRDPLYVKSPSQAAKLVREDFPNEKNWKATPLTDPKKKKADWDSGKKVEDTTGPGVGEGEGSDVPDGDGNKKKRAAALSCDMEKGCKKPVTHIDNKGYTYCTEHGARRKSTVPTRKLKPAEIKKLESGQTIRYGASIPMRVRTTRTAANLYVAIKGDRLLGATDGKHGANKAGWKGVERVKKVNSFEIVEAKNVPSNVAENMVDWGSDNPKTNYWKDEKTAFTNVKRYLPKDGGDKKAEETPKTAASGNYGFTKKMQADCDTASRRIAKEALRIAKRVYGKDARVSEFLSAHAKRGKSLSAKVLVAALQEMGPKLATGKAARLQELREANGTAKAKTAGSGENNAEYLNSLPARQREHMLKTIADHYGISTSEAFEEVTDRDAEKLYEYLAVDHSLAMVVYGDFRNFRFAADGVQKLAVQKGKVTIDITVKKRGDVFVVTLRAGSKKFAIKVNANGLPMGSTTGPNSALFQVCREEVRKLVSKEGKTAADKEAKYGLYGFRSKTSKLGLGACSELRHESGRIGSNLHRRRHDKHAKISEYLKAHCKAADCPYSRLLMAGYPGADMKFASLPVPASIDDWISWEE